MGIISSPKTFMKSLLKYTIPIALTAILFFSCSGKKSSSSGDSTIIIATSSWTAAYAEAAGAENVTVLAPFEMEHPSEYELRPGDISKLMNADVIIYAGYEVMTERLKKGLDIPQDKLLLVNTDYSFAAIEKSILNIAARLGTGIVARENLLDIRRAFDEGRKAVSEKNIANRPIIAHRFQSSLVSELGLVPVAVFGPASPEASAIANISKIQAPLIVDNIHNPVGLPFKEVSSDSRLIQLLNFPGMKGTKTITDVIRYNVAQITSD
jgi:ABC-type metal ion transport system, periplasmic component/surface adhesin